MKEAELVEDFLVGQRFDAIEMMMVDEIKTEMVNSVRTGIPFSVDLFVTGSAMYHLRVEHDGTRFVGRIFRGFSIDPRDQVAIADNGFQAVAEAAYEAIAEPEIIDTCVLEAEC